jgi:hypothetical protein
MIYLLANKKELSQPLLHAMKHLVQHYLIPPPQRRIYQVFPGDARCHVTNDSARSSGNPVIQQILIN